MAIAVDGTTPARWTGTVEPTTGGSIASASFTAPANALLVLAAQYDSTAGWTTGTRTVTDTGGLTWTTRVERLPNETTAGAGSGIWTARTTSAVSRTVSLALGSAAPGAQWGTGRASCKLYVLTGVDVDGTPVDTVSGSNEGGSTANPLTTTSVTPGATGLLIASDSEWNVIGAMTSSDLTIDSANYASALTVASGYKACTSGVGVTANLDPPAGTPQHKWCQIVVREAAGGGGTTPKGPLGNPFSGPFGGPI